MAAAAKKRKMNFSEREVEIIVEEIERRKQTLVGHFNAGVTHMAKNVAWSDILARVNAVTTCPRELPEVKKKWSDMKTEVRRKVAQARAAIDGTAADCAPVPVILTAMQQRICNLLGEATIVSLPAGEPEPEGGLAGAGSPGALTTEALPGPAGGVCEEPRPLTAEATYLEEDGGGGGVEYCAAVETPVEELLQAQAKPQELRSRIALNSARLLQEQRVTNLHVRQVAQQLEGQNELLQVMRRCQEAQAQAQERQAQALEGTQAALLALVQMLRPALKDLRKFLQGGGAAAEGGAATGTGAEEGQSRSRSPAEATTRPDTLEETH